MTISILSIGGLMVKDKLNILKRFLLKKKNNGNFEEEKNEKNIRRLIYEHILNKEIKSKHYRKTLFIS